MERRLEDPARSGIGVGIMPNPNKTSIQPGYAQFPPTLWSMVLTPARQASAESQDALATLCRAYWYPLHAFLRCAGQSPHEAEGLPLELTPSRRDHLNQAVAAHNGPGRVMLTPTRWCRVVCW